MFARAKRPESLKASVVDPPAGRVARPAEENTVEGSDPKPVASLTGDLIQRGRDRATGRIDDGLPSVASTISKPSLEQQAERTTVRDEESGEEASLNPEQNNAGTAWPAPEDIPLPADADGILEEARGAVRGSDVRLFLVCFAVFFPVMLLALSLI